MANFFIILYDFFRIRRGLFYAFLVLSVAGMSWFASRVTFNEDITGIFPDNGDSGVTSEVFSHLRVMDRMTLMISGPGGDHQAELPLLRDAALCVEQGLLGHPDSALIASFVSRVGEDQMGHLSDFVLQHLPLFLTDEDYVRMDSLLTPEGMAARMRRNYISLLSPQGNVLQSWIMKDPLGLSGTVMERLQDLQPRVARVIIDGQIFSPDTSCLLMFLTPVYPSGDTRKNEPLIAALEHEAARAEAAFPGVHVAFYGGPSAAVYNARQVKRDTLLTLSVALAVVLVFISLVFKRKVSILLLVTPVFFGILFSLCCVYFLKGEISAIAVGAGSVVLGIALSYAIHVLAHQDHVDSVPQLIRELAYPLTVGSFTTIGAFLGLMFTSSALLRDFGLFASLTLIGTTLFCLIFLPHFLKSQSGVSRGFVLRRIEAFTGYAFHRNRWLVAGVLVTTLVALFFVSRVRFQEDMMSLNYEPPHLKAAGAQLSRLTGDASGTVLFVSVGSDVPGASEVYARTNRALEDMQSQGLVQGIAHAGRFLVPAPEQQQRLLRWQQYWTRERKQQVRDMLSAAAAPYPFRSEAFEPFFRWLESPFETYRFEVNPQEGLSLWQDWINTGDSLTMLVTQARIGGADKEAVYEQFREERGVVVFDRAFFAARWVSAVQDDFYLILYVSSLLIFFSLLIAYGRMELTLMSFLPMSVSWLIILGLMGLLGIEFNIVNILFTTFIFGLGDDFSIFVMDGLQQQYRSGREVLLAHKTAIFFSAFTTVAGMGAMLFAQHPALRSISLIAILGMISVVVVSFTLQPVIYQWLIAGPASKGRPPVTLRDLLVSGAFFVATLKVMAILWVAGLLSRVVFSCTARRMVFRAGLLHGLSRLMCRLFLPGVRGDSREGGGVAFPLPSLQGTGTTVKVPQSWIMLRHSPADMWVLFSLLPRVVPVVLDCSLSRVERCLVRFAGGQLLPESMPQEAGSRPRILEMVPDCPEGFAWVYLTGDESTPLPLLPGTETGVVWIHGSARVMPEASGLRVFPGWITVRFLSRPFGAMSVQNVDAVSQEASVTGSGVVAGDTFGTALARFGVSELERGADVPEDPWFYHQLIRSFVFKGPVEEWYMRIKVRMEHQYRVFHDMIPLRARITDIGCGYGPLCFMLSMLSREREILGLDYDQDKIAVAMHSFARGSGLQFRHADALTCELPSSDVFVLSDVLHYMAADAQEQLVHRCASLLLPGGCIIVRDGNASDQRRHRLTSFTEVLSTRIFRFNKTGQRLCFLSSGDMSRIAQSCGLSVHSEQNDRYTSNTIYVLQKV